MIDLMMKMKLKLNMELLWINLSMLWMTIVVGWRRVGRWKKVGISSLSKKVMIRQARADYALVGIHLFDVLELSIRFCEFVGLIFVRSEHHKTRFWTNHNSPRLSDGQNALFFNNVEFIMTQQQLFNSSNFRNLYNDLCPYTYKIMKYMRTCGGCCRNYHQFLRFCTLIKNRS